MRRTATLALTAALMVTGTSAALAQPGPPSDIPAPPAQAQGSPETGQEHATDGRARASEQSGIDVPANDEAREDGRAFGEQRAAEATENADPQGSPATGAETSTQAREDGRAFGEQRAAEARARGEGDETDVSDETDVTTETDETDVTTEPADAQDVNLEEVTGGNLDDVELPDEATQASGVLSKITAALESVLNTLKGLFGFGTDAA